MKYAIYSIATTIALYFVVGFIRWDIAWVCDIPKWDDLLRAGLVVALLAKEIFGYGAWRIITFKKS